MTNRNIAWKFNPKNKKDQFKNPIRSYRLFNSTINFCGLLVMILKRNVPKQKGANLIGLMSSSVVLRSKMIVVKRIKKLNDGR